MSSIPSVGFDYATLPSDLADDARRIAGRIKGRIKTGYLATGHDLLEMKERLGHGHFGAWLEAEFGLSERMAERYMAAARFDTVNSDIMSDLLPATMHALAAPSVTEKVRTACVERVKGGEQLRPEDIATAVNDARVTAKRTARRIKAGRKHEGAGHDAIAEQEAVERHRLVVEHALAELVGVIVHAIGDDHSRVLALLSKVPSYLVPDALKAALETRAVTS